MKAIIVVFACFVLACKAANINLEWIEQPYEPLKIKVGDTVTFEWTGNHGVDQVPSSTCPEQFRNNPQVKTLAPSSNRGSFEWKAASPGSYYFACPVSDHCEEGQIIEVIVA